ncbi:sigma-70 family RNA polymerase sigma factor [Lachnospiraceae bacterium 3-1]|nr:sigma-70 family RNA polymerase sigma factor [Lachnospiraceae bacterium 3-1]
MNTPKVQQMQQLVEQELLASYDALYRLAFTYVKNESDAMDIVQESAYKAIRSAASVRNKAFIKTWLWRIVINTSMEFLREKQREISCDVMQEYGKEDIYLDFDTIEALDILNEKERAAVVLRYFEERKLQEIADTLDETLSATKSLLYRSLKKMKIKLTEGEFCHES